MKNRSSVTLDERPSELLVDMDMACKGEHVGDMCCNNPHKPTFTAQHQLTAHIDIIHTVRATRTCTHKIGWQPQPHYCSGSLTTLPALEGLYILPPYPVISNVSNVVIPCCSFQSGNSAQ